jgi:hypothetical protein
MECAQIADLLALHTVVHSQNAMQYEVRVGTRSPLDDPLQLWVREIEEVMMSNTEPEIVRAVASYPQGDGGCTLHCGAEGSRRLAGWKSKCPRDWSWDDRAQYNPWDSTESL